PAARLNRVQSSAISAISAVRVAPGATQLTFTFREGKAAGERHDRRLGSNIVRQSWRGLVSELRRGVHDLPAILTIHHPETSAQAQLDRSSSNGSRSASVIVTNMICRRCSQSSS